MDADGLALGKPNAQTNESSSTQTDIVFGCSTYRKAAQ